MEQELLAIKTNPQVLNDEELVTQLLQLQQLKKDIELSEKTYLTELKHRTNEETKDIGNYNVTYKSSKLFDKEKAREYVVQKDLLNEFMLQDLDFKKVQNYIKAMENYDNFTKESSKRAIIKRK